MGAPKGNQFWKMRSKHGRDKIFETSDIMWEACCEYFEWCIDNPLIEIDYKGKDAIRVELPKMRPYTLQGLSLFLDVNSEYFTQFERAVKEKEDQESKDFSRIITRVKEIIYNQKFTGAACGFLNQNIIARDLGLKDHTVNELEDKRKSISELFPEIDEEENKS